MNKKNDRNESGQFLSVVVNLIAVIRDTLKPMRIGIEIMPWLIGSGKKFFVEQCEILGQEFLKQGPLPGKPFMTVRLNRFSSIEAICQAIVASGKKISDYANQILRKISLSVTAEDVELFEVTVAELGFDKATELEIVFKRILDVGYVFCPAEAMALARIECNDGKWRMGAVELIADSDGDLHVLSLGGLDGLWLYTHCVSPDFLLHPDYVLVVALPRRK